MRKTSTTYRLLKLHSYLFLAVVLSFGNLCAQELEPRMLTNVPVGTNFLGVGYAYSAGNILLDGSIPIDDLDAKLHTALTAYVYAFDFFGKSAKVDVVMPWAHGFWDGYYEGVDTSTNRMGLGDPRFRLSVNLLGAPALSAAEYENYKQKTIVGVSIQIIDPIGTYYSDKLINLGSNRWTFKPQVGVSHKLDKWFLEGYVGLWIYGDNPNFYNGSRLRQNPIITAKTHVIHSFGKGVWAAIDLGYAYGGKTELNEVQRDDQISTVRTGLTVAAALNPQHSLKLSVYSGKRIKYGPDFNAAALIYQCRWQQGSRKQKRNNKEEFYSIN